MDILSKNMTSTFPLNLDLLQEILNEQLSHEKNGEYVQAEECRIKFEKEKMNQ